MVKSALLFAILAVSARGQQPSPAAIAGSGEDEAAVVRGGEAFAAQCASCHGSAARGLTPQTDLMRSALVRADTRGDRIGPFLRAGHPPTKPATLNETRAADVIAWLHAHLYGVAHAGASEFLNLLTGDPQKGREFFEGKGGCAACHSATGDLAGVGEKYDPPVLQSLWLNPRRRRAVRTVTVTPQSGPSRSGTLERIDEYNLVLRDGDGAYRSIALEDDEPRVEIHDPLQPHFDLYRRLTDAQIHDMTAYLATLK